MKGFRRTTAILMAIILSFVSLCPITAKAGQYADTVTVLVYMIGSSLESEGGAGTSDLLEMTKANYGNNVTVVVQTGGSKTWHNNIVDPSLSERYVVVKGGLSRKDQQKKRSMTDPGTLADFISWGKKNYPADRYVLILWDHGGGTVSGYGYDEYYPKNMMTISGLQQALEKGGCHFDIVMFDACLMCTLEIAGMLRPFADYLIASEELEPGPGYSYTGWLSLLCSDPSIPSEELGKKLIDDFAESYNSSKRYTYTLSMIDLSRISSVYDALGDFMDSSVALLDNKAFDALSQARSQARDFGNGKYEQIDIVDYASKVSGIDEGKLKKAVDDCVVYKRENLRGANGLAMYYPYKYLSAYDAVWSDLDTAGLAEDYGDYFKRFASIMTGGTVEAYTGVTGSLSPDNPDEWEASSFDWYDESEVQEYSSYYASHKFTMPEIIDKGKYYALPLTASDWDLLTYIEQWVYIDDGEGFVDLGADDYYEADDDGHLKVDYDYLWIAVNGQIVPYYPEDHDYDDPDNWYSYGRVPAVLNERYKVDVILCWDSNNEDGYVLGYRPPTDGLGKPTLKGLYELRPGDRIDALCNFYDYDGNFRGDYIFGNPIYVNKGGMDAMVVSYDDLGGIKTQIRYMLVDIYQNYYITEPVDLSF